jgi:hypothetical protein
MAAPSGISCSGGATCGDGVVDPGEQCDKGAQNGQPGVPCSSDCRSISVALPQLQVTWSLLGKTMVPDYDGANCDDFAAVTAHVEITGPASITDDLACTDHSKLYASWCAPGMNGAKPDCTAHLPAGNYQAAITLRAADGSNVTHAVSTKMVTVAPGPPVDLVVDFGMADFVKQDWTGSLRLRTSWGSDGAFCAAAQPAAAREAIKLTPAVSGMSAAGTPLDGTPADCYTPSNTKPDEELPNLPWGRYDVGLAGWDATGALAYCGSFPVFVGPGSHTQVWSITVPAASPPDGGAMDGGSANCF